MYNHYPVTKFLRHQPDSKESRNILKVYGEGNVNATPNQVTATIGVISEGKELTQVQKQNANTVAKVVQTLLGFNIPRNNIQTFDYQVNTEYDFIDGKQTFRGYRVQTLLKVQIDSIREIGEIINRVIEAGANYVSNIQFSVSNPEQYYLQALSKALGNAHTKAETIVTNIKGQLIPMPVRIEEIIQHTGPIQPNFSMVKGVASEQFQPGQLNFQATVLVKYHYFF